MRFALMVGLLLAAATTAHASWVKARVPGTPTQDVEVWAPGVFSVTTDQGAYLLGADGGVLVGIPTAFPLAGTYRADNCFMAFQVAGGGGTVSPCTDTESIIGQPIPVSRVEATESGAAYAVARETNAIARTAFSSATPAREGRRPWTEGQHFVSGVPVALGAARVGSSEHALFAMRSIDNSQLTFHWFIDGGPSGSTYGLHDGGTASSPVYAIDLVPGGGSAPIALYGSPTGLYRGALTQGGSNPFTEVSLPGGSGRVNGVDVNTGAGSRFGDGFGMATVERDGGVALLSAMPAGRPEEVGTQWRVNTTLPPEAVAPRYLECRGAEFCVLAQTFADAGNILIYTNAAPPTLLVDRETFVQEGTVRALPIFARDEDGDAVRVTAEPSGGMPPLSLSTRELGDGGRELLLDAGTVCADVDVPIVVTASDGLARHDQSVSSTVRVIHSRRPGAPGINDDDIIVEAGQGDVSLQLTAPADAPCPIASYRWSSVPQVTPMRVDGLRATFQTPPTLCDAEGMTYFYRVEAVDGANVASAPTDFTVQLRPWGLPKAPFEGEKQVSLLAPGGTRLTPQSTHECAEKPGVAFPGVDTRWELKSAGVPDGGVRLAAQDGTYIAGTRVVTPELRVEAEECAVGTLELSVQHFVRGSTQGTGGPPSTVRVTVTPSLIPPTDGQLTLFDIQPTPSAVAGMASVEGLNCLEQRGGVVARISAEPEGGGAPVRSREFTVPGPWLLELGDLCEGGRYRITGELLPAKRGLEGQAQVAGERAAQQVVAEETVTVPATQVRLKPLEDARLTARCGEPARGTLEQRIPAPCSNLPLTWDHASGPPLSPASVTGQRVELATQGTDFGALIGESVVLRVSSSTGQANPIEQPVLITAEPFIEVRRSTEKATGTEADLLGVSVELRNTTQCGVSQVEHVEHLEGVDYVPGSARFNGAPVEARLEGATLAVRGLVLEGDTTGVLTYVVRPRLLEGVRLEGQSALRGVAISRPLAEPPPSGCGCSGGGAGFAALGLAGLAAVLRRRRGR